MNPVTRFHVLFMCWATRKPATWSTTAMLGGSACSVLPVETLAQAAVIYALAIYPSAMLLLPWYTATRWVSLINRVNAADLDHEYHPAVTR